MSKKKVTLAKVMNTPMNFTSFNHSEEEIKPNENELESNNNQEKANTQNKRKTPSSEEKKSGGRPKAKNKRDVQVVLYLTPEEKTELQDAADNLGMPLNIYIRSKLK